MSFSKLNATKIIAWGFTLVSISIAGLATAANPNVDRFVQLSNVKDALEYGDCEKFGGYSVRGSEYQSVIDKTAGSRTYLRNNAKIYRGFLYVGWTFANPESKTLNALIGNVSRVVGICRFKF